jgi:hypothetical protein
MGWKRYGCDIAIGCSEKLVDRRTVDRPDKKYNRNVNDRLA